MPSSFGKGIRKALLVTVGAACAAALLVPSSAAAQSAPEAYICVGQNSGDGADWSFEPVQLGTGTIPGVGLGLSLPTCLATPNADRVAQWLQGIQSPGAPEVPEEIPNIPLPDPQNPLSVLNTVTALCSPWPGLCQAILGGALGAPLPIGSSFNLDGEGGSCEDTLEASGFAFGSGFNQLDVHIDWTEGILGSVAGTSSSFGSPDRQVRGALLSTGCGGGVSLGVLVIG